mgnify:CR=1 FL=1
MMGVPFSQWAYPAVSGLCRRELVDNGPQVDLGTIAARVNEPKEKNAKRAFRFQKALTYQKLGWWA